MIGRYASDGSAMFAHAIEGIEIIENAVRRDPENIELRKIRAQHSYRLPEAFFHRTAAAITDFEYLAAQFRACSSDIDSGEYQKILYQLGDCYRRLGMTADAREIWDELLNLYPDSPYAEAVRKQLNQSLSEQLLSPPEIEDIDDLLDWGSACSIKDKKVTLLQPKRPRCVWKRFTSLDPGILDRGLLRQCLGIDG